MKATGVVRRIDELGRVVIPMELRKTMHISEKDGLEIFVSEDTIVLKKYAPACVFTSEFDDLLEYEGRKVSRAAIIELAKLAGLI